MVPAVRSFDSISATESSAACIEVRATGVPPGLGEPLYDRLDADIAYAMMGINAVKGVEIGAGFASVAQAGTTHSDEMTPQGFLSNHAGGILGGISTGQPITVKDSTAGCALRSNKTVTVTGPNSYSASGNTNASGVAQVGNWILGGSPGANTMTATVADGHANTRFAPRARLFMAM